MTFLDAVVDCDETSLSNLGEVCTRDLAFDVCIISKLRRGLAENATAARAQAEQQCAALDSESGIKAQAPTGTLLSCADYSASIALVTQVLLHALQILWVAHCGLTGLEGLNALPCLKELYAAFNKVDNLEPVAGMARLSLD